MYFADNYFLGEERNGFYIRPMMKRVWAAQLEVLQEIDIICKNHDITWFADYGTMLGAVREGSYIAWDDDLDIGMSRMNFEKFKKYAKDELPKGYRLNNGRNGNIDDLVFRVCNHSGISWSESDLKKYHGCPYCVGVDIFPHDNIPDDPDETEVYVELFSLALLTGEMVPEGVCLYDCDPELKGYVDRLQGYLSIDIVKDKPLKAQMLNIADFISAMYFDADVKKVAVSAHLVVDRKAAHSKESIANVVYKDFEGISVPVPVGYHEILSGYYGDEYMIPKQAGADHEYPYFKAQEKMLFSWFEERGLAIPELFLN